MMKWHECAAIADQVEAKGDVDLAFLNRCSATKIALEEAVHMPEGHAREWLLSVGVAVQLDRIFAFANQHAELAGRIDYTDQIDLAVVLGRRDLAAALISVCMPAHNAFWAEYRKAIAALLDGKPYRAPEALKSKGIIATWVPNLKLAEALATNGEVTGALRAVDEAFAARQRDKRMQDSHGLDGDGHTPVEWNLRKVVLFAAAGRA